MTNMLIVITSKEGVRKKTALVIDKIEGFQDQRPIEDRIHVFAGGNVFNVCDNLDTVWDMLVARFDE